MSVTSTLGWLAQQIPPFQPQETPIPGLTISRYDAPTGPTSYTMEPVLCAVLQGAKSIVVGDRSYDFDPDSYILTCVDLPVVSRIKIASPQRPYWGLTLGLDRLEILSLLASGLVPGGAGNPETPGIAVHPSDPNLGDALYRLVGLWNQPQHIPSLAPLIKREIFYRLLVGPGGQHLSQFVQIDTHANRVARAIDSLKSSFAVPLNIKNLAASVHMSPTSFHQSFRQFTSMSPLQYQKWLRLHEARRLILVEGSDATGAAYQVGYESASQFNREYKRQFGLPPIRDTRQLDRLAGAKPLL